MKKMSDEELTIPGFVFDEAADTLQKKCPFCGAVCANGEEYAYHISHNLPDPKACLAVCGAMGPVVRKKNVTHISVDEDGRRLCRCGQLAVRGNKCLECSIVYGIKQSSPRRTTARPGAAEKKVRRAEAARLALQAAAE